MTWQLMWHNVGAIVLNAMFQLLIIYKCIICSLKFVEDNLFSRKIKQFLKLFSIFLSLQINHSIIFGFIQLIFIHVLGGLKFSKLCYSASYFPHFFFIYNKTFYFPNILFKFLILLKDIIMIIKTHHKITLDITQITDRHI